MRYLLFDHIKKFRQWSEEYSNIPEEKRLGEWEDCYSEWDEIYVAFFDFIKTVPITEWSEQNIKNLLYIIARDNESGRLIEIVSRFEDKFISLASAVVTYGPDNAKWQFAFELKNLSDKGRAEEILEDLIKDKNPYVYRIGLSSLADINSRKTEFYAKLAWKVEEEPTALYMLEKIKSPLLLEYIELAKKKWGSRIAKTAMDIEERLKNNLS